LLAGGSEQSSAGAAVVGVMPVPGGVLAAPRFTAGLPVPMWKLSLGALMNSGFAPKRQLSRASHTALFPVVPMMLLNARTGIPPTSVVKSPDRFR
jgi:hypothetical protein